GISDSQYRTKLGRIAADGHEHGLLTLARAERYVGDALGIVYQVEVLAVLQGGSGRWLGEARIESAGGTERWGRYPGQAAAGMTGPTAHGPVIQGRHAACVEVLQERQRALLGNDRSA